MAARLLKHASFALTDARRYGNPSPRQLLVLHLAMASALRSRAAATAVQLRYVLASQTMTKTLRLGRYTLHFTADAPVSIKAIFYVPQATRPLAQIIGPPVLTHIIGLLVLTRIIGLLVLAHIIGLIVSLTSSPPWLLERPRHNHRPCTATGTHIATCVRFH